MKHFYLAILVTISWSTLFSQAQLNTILSNDSIHIGQPAIYEITLLLKNESDSAFINWFIPIDSLSEGLEIIEISTIRNKENSYSISKKIGFRAEKIGYYPIKPIKVKVRDKSFTSQAKIVGVYSTLNNPAQEEIRAIKEGNYVSYGILDWLIDNWIWIGIFLIIMAATLIAVKRFTHRQNLEERPTKIAAEPKEPAYSIAQRKINHLSEKKPWQKGDLKAYHTSISYILREYLEGELGFQALEKSTSEILANCSKKSFSEKNTRSIRQLLSLTDLVKFAKQLPTEAENKEILRSIKEIIDNIHSEFSTIKK
jgi:hypothetical protein